MHANAESEKGHQTSLTDIVSNQSSNDGQSEQRSEEQERLRKRRLIEDARHHAQRFLELMLEATDKNSIDFVYVRANFNIVLTKAEMQNRFFIKTMANGKTRLFKSYRCDSLESWKKCQRYPCFKYNAYKGFTTCPYSSEGQETALPEKEQ